MVHLVTQVTSKSNTQPEIPLIQFGFWSSMMHSIIQCQVPDILFRLDISVHFHFGLNNRDGRKSRRHRDLPWRFWNLRSTLVLHHLPFAGSIRGQPFSNIIACVRLTLFSIQVKTEKHRAFNCIFLPGNRHLYHSHPYTLQDSLGLRLHIRVVWDVVVTIFFLEDYELLPLMILRV